MVNFIRMAYKQYILLLAYVLYYNTGIQTGWGHFVAYGKGIYK